MSPQIVPHIEVQVEPMYEQMMSFEHRENIFSYFVRIYNHSDIPVKLETRKWEIWDSCGIQYEVEGEGVVGKTPILNPGESFFYNSSVALKSDIGSMKGYYTMKNLITNQSFKTFIPKFLLVVPSKMN